MPPDLARIFSGVPDEQFAIRRGRGQGLCTYGADIWLSYPQLVGPLSITRALKSPVGRVVEVDFKPKGTDKIVSMASSYGRPEIRSNTRPSTK